MSPRLRAGRALVLVWSATVVVGIPIVAFPDTVPFTTLMIPLLLANNWFAPRQIPPFVGLVLAIIALDAWRAENLSVRNLVAMGVFLVVAVVMLTSAYRREKWGVGRSQGESMLVDLQDRILRSSKLPELPAGWKLQAAAKSADGASFSGDFWGAARHGDTLELAVVDVSGKGVAAGTRSMLMNGAVGGLLGAVPPSQFLPAANDYLLRQSWDEGFATAVHLVVNLGTGEFQLRSAGHPPAAQLHSGSGRWVVHGAEGALLGVMEDQTFEPPVRGRLERGDMIMMFTDGMVESARRELGLGIDQLLGQTERIVHAHPADLAQTLLNKVGVPDDDKALVLLTRT